jgi:hypothetical protein
MVHENPTRGGSLELPELLPLGAAEATPSRATARESANLRRGIRTRV